MGSATKKFKPQLYKPIHDIDAMTNGMNANLDHLLAIDAAARKAGSIKYRVFSIQVADGFAYYQAIDVNSHHITIQHITGIGDDYYAQPFGGGGKFESAMIRRMLGIPVA
jgi:hypothetical protein